MQGGIADKSLVIHIVDDDDGARGGLQELLDSHEFLTESYASAEAFLKQLPIDKPGCLLLDIHMPGMSGMELQQVLAERGCNLPIVFLTGHADVPTSVRAIKGGAEDFLSKLAEEAEVLDAIDRAIKRSLANLESDQQRADVRQRASSLTEREREVCSYLITGLLSKQIARRLGIADRTIKAHKASVLRKFDIESTTELVRLAQIAGIEPADA